MPTVSIAASVGLLLLGPATLGAQTTPGPAAGGMPTAYHEGVDREMSEILRNVVEPLAVRKPEGSLQQAVRRGGSFNFQLLSNRGLIPTETHNYVPAVLAAVNLLEGQLPSSRPRLVADSAVEVRP